MRDKAEKKLLTDRKIKNREKLVSDFDDLLAEPGNELGVEMPAKVRKAQQDLQANQDAIEFINWYDQRNEGAPLTPEGRNELKKRIVRKAIDNGEIRPDASPAPILDEPGPALQEMVLNPLRPSTRRSPWPVSTHRKTQRRLLLKPGSSARRTAITSRAFKRSSTTDYSRTSRRPDT